MKAQAANRRVRRGDSATDATAPIRAMAEDPAFETAPRASSLPVWLRPGAPGRVWIGVLVALAGFALIAVAWAQVAGEAQVYRQLPYLVSAGFAGLGLILAGLTLLNVATRQRDELATRAQLRTLVGLMAELRDLMSDRGER